MRIMIINPNTTKAMTDAMRESCSGLVAADTELLVSNPELGVPSIQGRADGIAAAYHSLNLVREGEKQNVDAYVIACFDDTGLLAARELARGPVLGIGQSAMYAATVLGARYSIITSLQRSVDIIENNALSYGLNRQCSGVHAVDLPVLELHSDQAYKKMLEKARIIIEKDKSDCLVLGCGGMTAWQKPLTQDLGITVIDGVTTALCFAESLVRAGLLTSKAITYAYPC